MASLQDPKAFDVNGSSALFIAYGVKVEQKLIGGQAAPANDIN